MISKLNIRQAITKDIEHIYLLEKSIFNENPWTKKMILSELKNHNYKKTLIIEKKHNMLGYLMIHFFQTEYQIINFGIKKEYQDRGIGRLFLNFFLNKIPYNSSVFLEVKESNFSAIKLYKNLGFVTQYIRKRYYEDGSNAINLFYLKK
jgi:ribosomal-protein-alanine N-acetyltransferase